MLQCTGYVIFAVDIGSFACRSHRTYAPHSCFLAEDGRPASVHWLADSSDGRAYTLEMYKIPAYARQVLYIC